MFEFEITERIAIISTAGVNYTLELNRVSYNGRPAKLDLRKWNGSTPLKGITLSDDEARSLFEALQKAGINQEPEAEKSNSPLA